MPVFLAVGMLHEGLSSGPAWAAQGVPGHLSYIARPCFNKYTSQLSVHSVKVDSITLSSVLGTLCTAGLLS